MTTPLTDLFSLDGQVAVVTGGNGGLGLAMARALRDAGATVVVTGRDPEKNAAVSDEFEVRPLDITDALAVTRFFDDIARDHGIHILVNNAGIYLDDPVSEGDLSAWERMIDVNLTGSLRCAREAARHMRETGSGKIINVGSVYSVFGHPRSAGYAATKAGLVGLTRSLAAELGGHGIQANAVLPGWFPTDINGELPRMPRGEEIRRRSPAGRWGRNPDLAGITVFFASRASDFVTGAAVPVDGGYMISDRFLDEGPG
ncbi:SDR family oxidoreductase [Streptomyces sp. SAI-127]|uniref:SDR family NAD(P)-dependent oxidoreductase n=1 Tax=Streptomyces sp. SAI-127 TaxID=2940543 RepID=UPI002475BCE4|nr:SDR family oxidoreductase [Streptomyces sp. SAI-127]MDH6492285.1 2-deoxy-D-gluconate 3-dehydrogenase [Streptomyces sp. SAI-127]